MKIAPEIDYETYYNYALRLSESFYAPDRYVALFPHIFGYSWFLSLLIKVFGPSQLLAPIINVVFSIISGVIIYRIAYLLAGFKGAVTAYVFWIICPSQTMYNSLVISDLFYTTMTLAFILIVVELEKKQNLSLYKIALTGVTGGVVLQCVNIARPIATILIITVLIWFFIISLPRIKDREFRKKALVFSVVVICVYMSFGTVWYKYMTARLTEMPASFPGYSIKVGFNMNSLGSWNIQDSELLGNFSTEDGATAISAQNKMWEKAKEQLTSAEIDFKRLFEQKFMTFLGSDRAAAEYLRTVLADREQKLSYWCDSFYYMLVMLIVFSVPQLFKTRANAGISLILLYSVGLILAQMLVEVAGRYHYSLIPMLIIIVQYSFKRQNFATDKDDISAVNMEGESK